MESPSTIALPELVRNLGSWRQGGSGYTELASSLRSLVLDGRLPLRSRLPSERALAAALGVSRTTTTAAYDVLRTEGFVESRQGSGSRIALPTGGAVDRELSSSRTAGEGIDLTIAALPAPGAMTEAVASATRDLAAHLGGIGYDPAGLGSLRRRIAAQFESRGLPTTEEQIVITSGAQHALRLLLDVLAVPGDPVLVEVPGYPNAFEALRRTGCRFVPAPMTRTGWDVEMVVARFREAVPRLAYMICDFQNPTGFLMGEDERAGIVAAARSAGAHLVVDETFAQLDLEPWKLMPGPVAGHDTDGRVVTVGSMSKAFWGGLRVGWIRCVAPLARRLAQARAGLDLSTPVFEQLVAERLLEMSRSVLAERRTLLTSRRDALVEALRAELPGWRFRLPRGGLCLWVNLDGPIGSEGIAEAAVAEGVRLIPGPTFTPDRTLDRWLRLPFTQPPEALTEAVARLAAAERRIRLGGSARPLAGWIA